MSDHAFWKLAKAQETRTDAERVALAAIIVLSTGAKSGRTFEQIYDELLGDYNHLFSHCDPLPRKAGGTQELHQLAVDAAKEGLI